MSVVRQSPYKNHWLYQTITSNKAAQKLKLLPEPIQEQIAQTIVERVDVEKLKDNNNFRRDLSEFSAHEFFFLSLMPSAILDDLPINCLTEAARTVGLALGSEKPEAFIHLLASTSGSTIKEGIQWYADRKFVFHNMPSRVSRPRSKVL